MWKRKFRVICVNRAKWKMYASQGFAECCVVCWRTGRPGHQPEASVFDEPGKSKHRLCIWWAGNETHQSTMLHIKPLNIEFEDLKRLYLHSVKEGTCGKLRVMRMNIYDPTKMASLSVWTRHGCVNRDQPCWIFVWQLFCHRCSGSFTAWRAHSSSLQQSFDWLFFQSGKRPSVSPYCIEV